MASLPDSGFSRSRGAALVNLRGGHAADGVVGSYRHSVLCGPVRVSVSPAGRNPRYGRPGRPVSDIQRRRGIGIIQNNCFSIILFLK